MSCVKNADKAAHLNITDSYYSRKVSWLRPWAARRNQETRNETLNFFERLYFDHGDNTDRYKHSGRWNINIQ